MRTAANALAAGGRLGEQVRPFPSTIPHPLIADGVDLIDALHFKLLGG
jgi:hypothetical protein